MAHSKQVSRVSDRHASITSMISLDRRAAHHSIIHSETDNYKISVEDTATLRAPKVHIMLEDSYSPIQIPQN